MQILFQKPHLKSLREQGLTYVDMHYHTAESDSTAKVFLSVKMANIKKMGLAITDHNKISAVLQAQKNKKLLLIPAIELTSYDYMDLLLYFYNIDELKEFYIKYVKNSKRPNRGFDFNRLKYKLEELLDIIKKYNCLKCIAHPFAPYPQNSYYYLKNRKDLIKKFDSIEVLNSLMSRYKNMQAKFWADEIKKAYTAGSDAHTIYQLGKALTISEGGTVEDFLNNIKKKNHFLMGEEVTGTSKLYSNLIIFKNNIRLRIQEEVEDIREEITDIQKEVKENIAKSKEKIKKQFKKL
jgi:hypothetical protein